MYRDLDLQKAADARRQQFLRSKKSATPPLAKPLTERIATFAKTRKLSSDAAAVLSVIVEHHERTGTPFTGDSFKLAKLTSAPFEAVVRARNELLSRTAIRTRSGNAFGIDGLVPSDAWNKQ